MQELEPKRKESKREKLKRRYERFPNLVIATGTVFGGGVLFWSYILAMGLSSGNPKEMVASFFSGFIAACLISLFLLYPFVLTVLNLLQLCAPGRLGMKPASVKVTDAVTALFGAVCASCYLEVFDEIQFKDWTEVLYNSEIHSPVATWTVPTLVAVGLAGAMGYLVLRYVPLEKLPPLACVFAMAGMYLGIGLCVLFLIQLSAHDWMLCLYAGNLLLIFVKTIRFVCTQHERAKHWCGWAFLLMWPLLGILVAFLVLFGQKPDSIIAAWTQTSDWTLSLQQAPPNVMYDEHYLCTVAAGGHPGIVRPLRMGERHGHRIVVNRQLLVANAFEELLSERLPGIHRGLRYVYDTYGYPVARHIKTRFAADLVYFLMKPLELFFVLVLYLFDAKPENRIAVQYLGNRRNGSYL